jgi:signal transduction histidine kinase
MDLPSTQTNVGFAQANSVTETRLHGKLLMLARGIWVVLVLFALILLAFNLPHLPLLLAQIQASCEDAQCTTGFLSQDALHTLHTLGVLTSAFAIFYAVIYTFIPLVVWVAAGLFLAWRKSDDWMALLVSLFLILFQVSVNLSGFISTNLASEVTSTQTAPVWFVLFYYFSQSLAFPVLALFPNGRFVPRWMLWPTIAFVVADFLNGFVPSTSPLGLISFLLLLASFTCLAGTMIYRYRRGATLLERQQIKWLAFGVVLDLILNWIGPLVLPLLFPQTFAPHSLPNVLYQLLWPLTVLIIPISIGIAILRYRLWDIDIIISHTLVYGVLSACVIGIYILVVGYLGALFHTNGNLLIELLATSCVAVFFQPLREWLQRGVNRLIYGQRDEPYTVVSRLGKRLENTFAPDAVLPAIVETVAQALKLPYAAITLKQEEEHFQIVAAYGMPVEAPLSIPLIYQSEPIGQLVLGPRSRGENFTPTDRVLLTDLARQIGIAAHAVRLTGDLQRSRERLVIAREEERRRLRRDLHDGLGSVLTSMTFKLDASDTLFERDPGVARRLLAEVRTQMQTSLNDIRHIIYNLRPPILDEWGLVPALREQVAQHQLNQMRVSIEAPESFPALSAAVEVAAYRVALEALSNVLKHAQATACTIRLALLDDVLTVEVQDNGTGPGATGYHVGVGISAMRERAVELGGTCVVEASSAGGTCVCARFPVRKE